MDKIFGSKADFRYFVRRSFARYGVYFIDIGMTSPIGFGVYNIDIGMSHLFYQWRPQRPLFDLVTAAMLIFVINDREYTNELADVHLYN